MKTPALESMVALLVACTSAPEATAPLCASGTWCAAAQGCNWCACNGSCINQCTAACPTDGGAFVVDCDEAHPCPVGACVFDQGCAAPRGRCVTAQCPSDGRIAVCGCDGRTYNTQCPQRPYRHAGACP
jgi:hypothetical protein